MKPIDTDDEPDALRLQYEKYGVEGYYSGFGAGYRNPHEPEIRRLLGSVVEKWRPDLSSVLDLACGSGEVTLALRDLGASGPASGPERFAALIRTQARHFSSARASRRKP